MYSPGGAYPLPRAEDGHAHERPARRPAAAPPVSRIEWRAVRYSFRSEPTTLRWSRRLAAYALEKLAGYIRIWLQGGTVEPSPTEKL